jgi:hypothetical protein
MALDMINTKEGYYVRVRESKPDCHFSLVQLRNPEGVNIEEALSV